MARVINQVQEPWTKGRIVGILLIDGNLTFANVSTSCLFHNMESMDIDRDVIQSIASFMSDTSIGFVYERHECIEVEVETEVLHEYPMSHILFTIYLSGVFREVKTDEE